MRACVFWHENLKTELKKVEPDTIWELQMIALCDKYGWTYNQVLELPCEWTQKLLGYLSIQSEKNGR